MRYLITGITGFVGPHLAKILLYNGHEVYGLVRGSNGRETELLDVLSSMELEKIKFVYGDLINYPSIHKLFTDTQFDGVFHLAAQSHVTASFSQPILTYQTNVLGSVYLITCISQLQKDCRLHFCSTSEVYGNQGENVPILKETLPVSVVNPYAASKAAIDIYMQERIENKMVNGFITRAFSHTGPRRGFNFSISSDAYQIAKMKLGLQNKILLVGNLETYRVVMDVEDCVRAYYLLMLDRNITGVYNVCGEDSHKMQYFTDMLIKQSGMLDVEQKVYSPFYRDIDIQVQIGDTTKLRKDIFWYPQIPIEQTLTNLLNYWVTKLSKGG